MVVFVAVIAKIVAITLDFVAIAMFARAIMPLFLDAEKSKAYLFVALITEPFIVPVRFIMTKFNLLSSSPIDWSFTVTYLLIILIRSFLPAF